MATVLTRIVCLSFMVAFTCSTAKSQNTAPIFYPDTIYACYTPVLDSVLVCGPNVNGFFTPGRHFKVYDPDNMQTITWTITTPPTNTTLSGFPTTAPAGPNSFPLNIGLSTGPNFLFLDSFIVTASDGNGGSATRKIYIRKVTTVPNKPCQIVGPTPVCRPSSHIYTTRILPKGSGHTWNYTGLNTTLVSLADTAVMLNFSDSATSGYLIVTDNNCIGSSVPDSLTIIIDVPFIGLVTGPSGPFCPDDCATFHVNLIVGASYLWFYTGGGPISYSANICTICPPVPGGLTAIVDDGLCTSSAARGISIAPIPSLGQISGDSFLCKGFSNTCAPCGGTTINSSNTYTINSVSAITTYDWILDNTYVGSGLTFQLNISAITLGNHTLIVEGTDTCGRTVLSPAKNINVDSAPDPPVWIAGNHPTLLCRSHTYYYAVTQPARASFADWSSGNFCYPVSNFAIFIVPDNNSTSGILSVKGSNSCGCSAATTQNVIILDAPQCQPATNITATSADLNWTNDANSPPNGYEAIATQNSSPPASGNYSLATPYNQTGLTPNTTYYEHIRTRGDNDAFSNSTFTAWDPVSFHTLPEVPNSLVWNHVSNTIGTETGYFSWQLPTYATESEYVVSTSSTPPSGSGTLTTISRTPNITGPYGTPQHIFARTKTTSAGVDYFSEGWATINHTLPIQLMSFTGLTDGKVDKLFWRSGHEDASNYFEVQRSPNGKDFIKLDTIQGTGSNSEYSFIDKLPINATNYYRLSIVEPSGKNSYSNVVVLRLNGQNKIEVVPNPFKGEVLIIHQGITDGRLNVYDLLGKKILQHTIQGNESLLDLRSYPSGQYMIQITNNGQTQTIKITKE